MDNELELISPILEIVDHTIHICFYVENLFSGRPGGRRAGGVGGRGRRVEPRRLFTATYWRGAGLAVYVDFRGGWRCMLTYC